MKKYLKTILFFLLTTNLIGQIPPTVKNVFFNLPLDGSRTDIQKVLKSDKRFISTATDTSYFIKLMDTYLGWCTDQGIVKAKADSVEIELSFGFGTFPKKKKSTSNFGTLLKIRYFYNSPDSVEKEYKNILSVLRPIFKDTSFTQIDTVFSDSPLRRQFKAKGMTFKNQKAKYSIRVLNASLTKQHFGLFIEYERDEK